MSNSKGRDEIGNYSIATRFGKGRRLKHDSRLPRPATRAEMVEQIEATFRHNRWGINEQSANSRMLGLETKSLINYTDAELKIILGDLEKHKMILYSEDSK